MKKHALLSVSDKSGIAAFARELAALGYEIISTGGTLKTLLSENIPAIDAGGLTGYGELFGGRIKTLHPKIHGGILFRRSNEEDAKTAAEMGIGAIDLVCVNLYPFQATIDRVDDFGEIIENIDIGGPAMIRSAAKNFESALVIVDPADYPLAIGALKSGGGDYGFRAKLMIKAFEHTAWYDSVIASYMSRRFKGAPDFMPIGGRLVSKLRYGENPHQNGFLYQFDDFYDKNFRVLKGEASFNNLTDISAAVKIARAFDENAVCVVKHGNPCGFALRGDLREAWEEALKCDKLSAYGGVAAINGEVDEKLARKINEIFIEAIAAPSFTAGAIAAFESKKRLKLFKIGDGERLPRDRDKLDFKRVLGGFVAQDRDEADPREIDNASLVTETKPSEAQIGDLKIAWIIAALTKSNCVTYVKDRALVAIGMGMTSRVDAAKAAMAKAAEMGVDTAGSSMASEAFFPFKDSIEAAAKGGISAIAQPGGSVRDSEVIAAANEFKIAMLFTGVRHFLH